MSIFAIKLTIYLEIDQCSVSHLLFLFLFIDITLPYLIAGIKYVMYKFNIAGIKYITYLLLGIKKKHYFPKKNKIKKSKEEDEKRRRKSKLFIPKSLIVIFISCETLILAYSKNIYQYFFVYCGIYIILGLRILGNKINKFFHEHCGWG